MWFLKIYAVLELNYVTLYLSLKTETVSSSEVTVNFYQTTRCHIPEDSTVHSHCENLETSQIYHDFYHSSLTKFIQLHALQMKHAELASNMNNLFLVFGAPVILHSKHHDSSSYKSK
jgi:hypothetical protein